jgi:hypothetical protein
MSSPRQTFTGLPAGEDRDIDREIAAIEQAVAEGPMSRQDLARTVRARNWGPGRFRRALRVAESERRITRLGRDTYQLA